MPRVATFMSVKSGLEERYVEEHRNIWPEIVDGIRRFGIRNYSIFMHGRELYSYFEVDNLQRAMAMAAADPDNQRWQAHMADFFDISPGIQNGTTVTLAEVYHTDGYTGPLNQVQRVGTLMPLPVGMEKAEELRNIWHNMLRGIAKSKIRNYTIFQIGKMLFSYVQVEDLDKAMQALADDPEYRRWQEHLRGMSDGGWGSVEGTPIFLREVFFLSELTHS